MKLPGVHAETTHLTQTPAAVEFERQLETLVAKGYPWSAGLTDEQFRELLEPLAERAAALPWPAGAGAGAGGWGDDGPLDAAPADDDPAALSRRIPFALVIGRELIAPLRAAERIERRGRPAIVTMLSAGDLDAFAPIESVALPAGDAYLIADVDTGWGTRGDPPETALPILTRQRRSPLTLEEGIALVTHFPEAVATNAGFSLLGSRRGDRRVTALWISRGSPKLGWCFAGAPHTWLGSASCARRVGA